MSDNEETPMNQDSALAPQYEHTGFFGDLWQRIRLVYKLMLDPEVPIYLKILPFAALVYLLLPIDFLPDVIPGFGQLDDVTILILGAKFFIDLAPQQIVARHLRNMRSQEGNLPTGENQAAESFYSGDPDIIEGVIIEDVDIGELSEDGEAN